MEKLNRTMNSIDCLARGAALQAAMLSPNIKSSVYSIEGNPNGGFPLDQFLPTNLTYNGKVVPLFNPGSPPVEGITFKHTGKVWQQILRIPDGTLPMSVSTSFAVNSGEISSPFNLPTKSDGRIAQYKITELKPSNK